MTHPMWLRLIVIVHELDNNGPASAATAWRDSEQSSPEMLLMTHSRSWLPQSEHCRHTG